MKELVITNIGTIVTGKLTEPITDRDTIAIRDGVIAEIGGPDLLQDIFPAVPDRRSPRSQRPGSQWYHEP